MEHGNLISAILLTLGAGLATGLGGVIIMFTKKFSTKKLTAALGFSAGVMIFISLTELFFEAKESLESLYGGKQGMFLTLVAFFAGMGLIALIDYLVPASENPHEVSPLAKEVAKCENISKPNNNILPDKLYRVGMLSTIVIAVHNFPEGIATFASAMESPTLGASIAFAIALHNIPEGISIALPIYYSTKKRGKAILYATLSGLAEPIGGLVGYFLLSNILNDSFLGIILAAVAGIMVYISLDELLPTAESYGHHHISIGGVVIGMMFIGFGLLLF